MVWPFTKKQGSGGLPRVLPFKDGVAFFEYQCEYGYTEVRPKQGVVALVLDASKDFGASQPVSSDFSGIQTAALKVASKDGGFLVSAQTAGPNGDRLKPGDLVVWVPLEHFGELVPEGADTRFGWIGFIVAKIRPEIDTARQALSIECRYA